MKKSKVRNMIDQWIEENGESVEREEIIPSLDYQLGQMTAEYVIATALPTLSTDILHTSYIIDVDDVLTEEWEKRQNEYYKLKFNDEEATEIFYANRRWYKENIEAKYLKEELKVRVPKIHPEDLIEFEKGFEQALWDCDLSHYWYGGFEQTDPYAWCSFIILKKDKDENNQ